MTLQDVDLKRKVKDGKKYKNPAIEQMITQAPTFMLTIRHSTYKEIIV